MKIRKAELWDLEEIIILNKIDDYENPDIYIKCAIENWLVKVAIMNNVVVWFSLLELVWWNTPLVALVKIHPLFQRKGIGRSLMQSSEDILIEKWYTFCCSSTMYDNISARKFHQALGFVETWVLNFPHGREVFYRKDM